MPDWGNCYLDHYERHLGEPIGHDMFTPNAGGPRIQVLIYERAAEQCLVFCTLGLSHYAPELGRTAEVCLCADDGWDDAPYLLASALFYTVERRMQLGWGISIGGIHRLRPAFAEQFGKEALYLTTADTLTFLPETFGSVQCGGKDGDVFLGVFVSAAEYAYFGEHGADGLEALFAEHEADPCAVARPSCA